MTACYERTVCSMNILICNDDGIDAQGIKVLAEIASEIGNVYVVAPSGQRSAVSHGITIGKDIPVWKVPFDADVAEAYSVDGTPADCARVGINALLPSKPDLILSGINYGYNLGFDICYSGTVGAAREGHTFDIPAIAISMEQGASYDIAKAYLVDIIKDIIEQNKEVSELWNINFPVCKLEEVKGIKHCIPAPHSNFAESYTKNEVYENEYSIKVNWVIRTNEDENTDIYAVANNYIAVSKIKNFY